MEYEKLPDFVTNGCSIFYKCIVHLMERASCVVVWQFLLLWKQILLSLCQNSLSVRCLICSFNIACKKQITRLRKFYSDATVWEKGVELRNFTNLLCWTFHFWRFRTKSFLLVFRDESKRFFSVAIVRETNMVNKGKCMVANLASFYNLSQISP